MAETASAYPVQTSFGKPEDYDRIRLLLRIAIWIVAG